MSAFLIRLCAAGAASSEPSEALDAFEVDDARPDEVDAACKIIRRLNADAEDFETNHSDITAAKILDTGLFDVDKAYEHPMGSKELYGFADPVPESEEYGVTSYNYRARPLLILRKPLQF